MGRRSKDHRKKRKSKDSIPNVDTTNKQGESIERGSPEKSVVPGHAEVCSNANEEAVLGSCQVTGACGYSGPYVTQNIDSQNVQIGTSNILKSKTVSYADTVKGHAEVCSNANEEAVLGSCQVTGACGYSGPYVTQNIDSQNVQIGTSNILKSKTVSYADTVKDVDTTNKQGESIERGSPEKSVVPGHAEVCSNANEEAVLGSCQVTGACGYSEPGSEAIGENVQSIRESEEDDDENSILYRIIQIVMRKCLTAIVEHLEPDHVLDLFQEKDVFKPLSKSKVKDMRNLKYASSTNQEIIDCITRDPRIYSLLKFSLAKTAQNELTQILEKQEEDVHDELKARCHCKTSTDCSLLKSVRYSAAPKPPRSYTKSATGDFKGSYVTQIIDSQNVQIGTGNILKSKTVSYADTVKGTAATVAKSPTRQTNAAVGMETSVLQKIEATNVTINVPPLECAVDAPSTLHKRSADFEKLVDVLKTSKSNQYILVAGNTPFSQSLGVIANLPLIAVLDFDQHSRKEGLYSYLIDNLEQERSVHVKTWLDKCTFTLDSTHWIFLRGCIEHPDSLTKHDFDSWKDQIKSKFKSTGNKLEEFVGEACTVLVLWPPEQSIDAFLIYILGRLSNALDPRVVIAAKDTKKIPSLTGFNDITVVELGVNDVCSAIKSLSSPTKRHSTDFKLPTNEGAVSCLAIEEANWLKEDLEILFIENQTGIAYTPDDLRKEEDNFFKGGTLPWACWYEFDSGYLDAKREIMSDMISWIDKHLSICRSGCISLFHDPGAGGTTLAQRIIWEFRQKTPCVQIKQSSETSLTDTAEKLELLSSKTHLPILLLIDGLDEQRVENLQQRLRCSCIILYVKRCINPSSNPKFGRFALTKTLSPDEVKKVTLKYVDQCQRHKKSEKQIETVKRFSKEVTLNKAEHYLFEFGLAVHTYEYRGIISYVKEILQLKQNSSKTLLPWQRAVAFLALVYFYGQSSISNQFLAHVFGLGGKTTLRSVEDFPEEMRELIVSDTHVGRAFHTRISNYYIAKEILEQILVFPKLGHNHDLLPKLSIEAKPRLHNLAIDFIKQAEDVSCGKANTVHTLLIRTFISRYNKAVGENETRANKSRKRLLSPILEDVSSKPPYTERFLVLDQLADSFPSEPQFLAHLGRLYTICRPNEIEIAERCFKEAELMCNRRIAGLRNADIPYHVSQDIMHIYHMYGNMFVTKVAPYTGRYLGDYPMKPPGRSPITEVAVRLLKDVQSACRYFSKCREIGETIGYLGSFGYIGEINIRLMYCGFVSSQCSENDIHHFINANSTDVAEFVRDSYNELHDLFLECFSLIEPEKLDRDMANCQEWFTAIFGDVNPGCVIRRSEDNVYSRRMQVAQVKMKYCKNKSVGVLEYINDEKDIMYIVKQYEKNIEELKYSSELPYSKRAIDIDFREWLCAIRHRLFPEKYTVEMVFRNIQLWNDKLQTPFARFYLFVFTSLLGFGSSNENSDRVLLRESDHLKIEMLKYAKQMTKPRYPREWLGPPSKYADRLIPGLRFFRELSSSNVSEASYQILIGTIKSPNNKRMVGYIDLDLGSNNTVAVEVFYVPAVAKLNGRHYSGKRVEFALGFSMSHGYEAFHIKLLKSETCKNCGYRIELRSCDLKVGTVKACDSCGFK